MTENVVRNVHVAPFISGTMNLLKSIMCTCPSDLQRFYCVIKGRLGSTSQAIVIIIISNLSFEFDVHWSVQHETAAAYCDDLKVGR